MKNISFILNTSKNTLEHVKLLMRSLKENLRGQEHEILIFVDSDNENTVDYLRSIKKDYFDLKFITHKVKPCIGYSRNSNILVELAKHDIVSYLQSDMVISKDYDVAILQELEDNCILSSTRVEPPLHQPSPVTITQDFGIRPKEFMYDSFMNYAETVKESKSIPYFFAPFTFHKQTWLSVGGYDTRFRKSREDSDLLQRFVQTGVKIKQTYKAIVYHFSCVTSRGPNWFDTTDQESQARNQLQQMADNIEMRRFVRRWGNFAHGQALEKYEIDLVLNNVQENQIKDIANIEPYFSRVWIDSESVLSAIKDLVSKEHVFANYLLGFSENDWEESSKYYNQTNYSEVYKFGKPNDWKIKIELDLTQTSYFLSNLVQLSEIIRSAGEPGYYEIGNENQQKVYINIRSIEKVMESMTITNPPFDMSLLTVE